MTYNVQALLPLDLPYVDIGGGVGVRTSCGYCTRVTNRNSLTFVSTSYDDYCCEECADADALRRLREAGL